MTIVKRLVKGSELTHAELDGNFTDLHERLVAVEGGGGGGGPTVQGNLSPYTGQTVVLTITNYDSATTYTVSATGGTVSRTGDQITYIAGSTTGEFAITINGRALPVTVQVVHDSYIATPAPTPANYGDAFEGGFYKGMLWNQIAQSSSSKSLVIGTQAFTVPDMTSTPIVYGGQLIEVRSRANPNNKFVGTVTGAVGTTLTLNVTAVTGNGTFSDWSVMARFRYIVAPKSSGETNISIKNAQTALPAACQTLTEGYLATKAMVEAGNAATYPAAHWAWDLVINGKDDWFLDTRDSLELSWRNLKPTTLSNYTGADRTPPSWTESTGAYSDASTSTGVNKNSYPEGVAYSAGSPSQITATAFQAGGVEAYAFGSAYYLTCTEHSAAGIYGQYWYSDRPGAQKDYGLKTNVHTIRAVRRSII